jgi:hypothetical protein
MKDTVLGITLLQSLFLPACLEHKKARTIIKSKIIQPKIITITIKGKILVMKTIRVP